MSVRYLPLILYIASCLHVSAFPDEPAALRLVADVAAAGAAGSGGCRATTVLGVIRNASGPRAQKEALNTQAHSHVELADDDVLTHLHQGGDGGGLHFVRYDSPPLHKLDTIVHLKPVAFLFSRLLFQSNVAAWGSAPACLLLVVREVTSEFGRLGKLIDPAFRKAVVHLGSVEDRALVDVQHPFVELDGENRVSDGCACLYVHASISVCVNAGQPALSQRQRRLEGPRQRLVAGIARLSAADHQPSSLVSAPASARPGAIPFLEVRTVFIDTSYFDLAELTLSIG